MKRRRRRKTCSPAVGAGRSYLVRRTSRVLRDADVRQCDVIAFAQHQHAHCFRQHSL